MRNITEILEFELKKSNDNIKDTKTDYRVFERNIFYSTKVEILEKILNNIYKHKSYINNNVYKYVKSFNYITKTEYDELTNNKTIKLFKRISNTEVLFTEELFNNFVIEYINYVIDYKRENILNNMYSNSTSPMSNYINQLENESTLELIKLFEEELNKDI